ncbi:MAG: hypothetical protein A2V76_01515 [Candidatus Aminicenantes bacterium RBG_16_63_14]|nr:MAG: hypothetical protein A2V76_01515 [Candidatus Aminicenantes bacterium RBG_16_63_14]
MQQRKDRRFKQWSRTVIKALPQGQDPLGQAETNAFTYDLSLGGARIYSVEPFEVGTLLRLHIELARTRETVSLEGRVKWLKRNDAENIFEIGVEFHHATSHTVMSLMKNLHNGQH